MYRGSPRLSPFSKHCAFLLAPPFVVAQEYWREWFYKLQSSNRLMNFSYLRQCRCNGELRLPRFKTPPLLIHRWIRTPPVLIHRWIRTPPVLILRWIRTPPVLIHRWIRTPPVLILQRIRLLQWIRTPFKKQQVLAES